MGKPILDTKAFRGRIPLHDGDIETLYEVASLGKTYVEIGTLFGASACIAGLAGCDVYCIDPLDGYNIRGVGDPFDVNKNIPSPRTVQENWIRQGLDISKLHIYAHYHPPWPREINFAFDVGLIDGNHYAPNVWLDYDGMNGRIQKYLLMHDTHLDGVRSIYESALKTPKWERYTPKTKKERTMGVLANTGGMNE